MEDYLNDLAIESPEDDLYGVVPFAEALAKSILSIRKPIGTTFALHGPWGSGKSSVVNLVRRELNEAGGDKLEISDFRCWWFRGEEALALAFLQNLNALVSDSLGKKSKDLVPRIGRLLLQGGPVIGSAMTMAGIPGGGVANEALSLAQQLMSGDEAIDGLFQKLAKQLEKQQKRFLIVVDDLDRLSPEEAIAIFRIIRSVGHLPNVIYLLVFDRHLAERAVKRRYPSEGPQYLEKIIQISYELPAPLQVDLNRVALTEIYETCGSHESEEQVGRTLNLFHDVVAPYLTTPRHVVRFANAIRGSWPAIDGEISVADFIALETLRLYEPSAFSAIRLRKGQLCGLAGHDERHEDREARFKPFLVGVTEDRHETVKRALQRLFPRMMESRHTNDFLSIWDADRLVCIDAHFDTYFRLSLSDETLSMPRIKDLIARSDDRTFLVEQLREASKEGRRSGTSMLPVLLDEIRTHAHKIDKDKIEPLLSTLFELHDEIDLDIDRARGFLPSDNSLRCHWIMNRLTEDRFTLEERSNLYLAALKQASLGWLVGFARRADEQHAKFAKGERREEDLLVDEATMIKIVKSALQAIRAAAKDQSLLDHKDLMHILYSWKHFQDGNPKQPRAWTDKVLNNDRALVVFARRLTGEAYSQSLGFDGLGDRVSKISLRAQINDQAGIIDHAKLRKNLERLQESGKLPSEDQEAVDTFLAAWDEKNAGKDDWG